MAERQHESEAASPCSADVGRREEGVPTSGRGRHRCDDFFSVSSSLAALVVIVEARALATTPKSAYFALASRSSRVRTRPLGATTEKEDKGEEVSPTSKVSRAAAVGMRPRRRR